LYAGIVLFVQLNEGNLTESNLWVDPQQPFRRREWLSVCLLLPAGTDHRFPGEGLDFVTVLSKVTVLTDRMGWLS
jgi:hypothetical protein